MNDGKNTKNNIKEGLILSPEQNAVQNKLEQKINNFLQPNFNNKQNENFSSKPEISVKPSNKSYNQTSEKKITQNSTPIHHQHQTERFETPKSNWKRESPANSPWERPSTPIIERAPLRPNINIQATPFPDLMPPKRNEKKRKEENQETEEERPYTPLTEITNYKIAKPPPSAAPTQPIQKSPRNIKQSNAQSQSQLQHKQPSSFLRPPKTAADTRSLRLSALRLQDISGLPDSEYDTLIADFADERRRCIFSHNFQDSKHLTDVINHLCQCQVKQRKENAQMEAIKQYEETVRKFEEDLKAFDTETKQQLQENRNKFLDQFSKLAAQHRAEQIDLQQRWSTKAKLRQYAHASQELIQMRKQLKQEIIAERFDAAQEYQKRIIFLEERDKRNAHAAMQRDFDTASDQLQAKQNQDVMFLKEQLKQTERQIIQRREKLRAAFLNRAKKIEQQRDIVQDPEKVWNQLVMQRRDELAKGNETRRSMPSRRIRMSDMEGNNRLYPHNTSDTSITLPPLNFSRLPKTPKTTRPYYKTNPPPRNYRR